MLLMNATKHLSMKAGRPSCLFLLLLWALYCMPMMVVASAEKEGPSRELWQRTRQQSSEAYVTLLYGDEFVLGVRVLGKSIRDTGTSKDLVALVSDGVSPKAIHLLQADGWIVEKIELLANPNHKRPKRFWGVYTKLKIFNMTNYKKVLYLDADTVVLRSIEELFQCSKFCANLKHSERLNSGVMVVEPSKDLFDDMMTKVSSLPSYTGGDQGFLNSYFPDFPNAHLFDPNLSQEERNARPVPNMERLSTLYNADVGLYMLANKWMVDGRELRVVHYTLGPLKPWDWWTSWLLKPVDLWQNVRITLQDSLPGTGGGRDPHIWFVIRILSVFPFIVLVFIGRQLLFQIYRDLSALFWNGSFCSCMRQLLYKYTAGIYSMIFGSPSNGLNQQQYTNIIAHAPNGLRLPSYLQSISVGVAFVVAGGSSCISFMIIPTQVMPWTGMLLLYEWTFFLYAILYGKYLAAVYSWGTTSAVAMFPTHVADSSYENSAKGNLRKSSSWDAVTFSYGFGMACIAILAPSLPFLFGVTALFLRLGMMIGGAMVLVAFMTYASEHLAVYWFLRGRDSCLQSPDTSLFSEL